jgi:hypothetical protein
MKRLFSFLSRSSRRSDAPMRAAMILPGAVFLASSGPASPADRRQGLLGRWISSLVGWLGGRNRKRDSARGLVPRDVLLRQVRPIRSSLEEESGGKGGRRPSVLLHESARVPVRSDDQDNAWNRLRNRRQKTLVVSGD